MTSRVAGAGSVGIAGAEHLEDHSIRIVRSVAARLERLDFRVIYFAGGFPGSPLFKAGDGSLRIPKSINRLLVLGEALRGREAACAAILDAPPCPIVTMGGQSKRRPDIATLEPMGIWQAVGHLARHHNRKSVALLAGVDDSSDTDGRVELFKSAVEGFNVNRDPNLILRTASTVAAGREGVRELLRRSRGHFDALAVASDALAIGAIEALRESGIVVPRDVSVIGFGDVAESAFMSPSLSTVRPAHDGYAARAVAGLLSLEATKGEPWETPSAATLQLILRESCGCKVAPASAEVVASKRHIVDDAMRRLVARHLAADRRRQELAASMQRLVEAENLRAIAQELSVVRDSFQFARILVGLYSSDGQGSRIAFSSERAAVVAHVDAPTFPIEEGLPGAIIDYLPACSIYVAPLATGSETLGYLAIQSDLANADEACRQLDLARSLSLALCRVRLGRELARLYELERKFAAAPPTLDARSGSAPPPALDPEQTDDQ